MRASGPRWPAGHLERGADPADRDEAELPHRGRVPRARDVDGAEPLERRPAGLPVAERQQRVDGAAGSVLLHCSRVRGDGVLRGGQQLRVSRDRVGTEEDVVRLLRRAGKGAAEAVDEDDDAAFLDGERVPPQPERMRKPEMGHQERVRFLARQERRRGRDPDHECVERLVEGRQAQLDRAEQGLCVGD